LDLDDNNLFGLLPAELSFLTKLQFLLLNRNQLSGGIPDEYDLMTSLRMAFFDRNKLNGTMAPMCRVPAFSLPRPSSYVAGSELITADCGFGGTDPEITCTCCTLCCYDALLECNNNQDIPNLNPTWEASFNRVFYKFGEKASHFATVDTAILTP
jgi:hypothetical protein